MRDTPVGVAKVTRTSGMSVRITVRCSADASARITSAKRALAKSRVLGRAGSAARAPWARSHSGVITVHVHSAHSTGTRSLLKRVAITA